MGYYIPNNQPMSTREVEQINQPTKLADIPEDKALICTVDNGFFIANGLIYSERELEDFSIPTDTRPKKWYLMDKQEAHKLSNYNQ